MRHFILMIGSFLFASTWVFGQNCDASERFAADTAMNCYVYNPQQDLCIVMDLAGTLDPNAPPATYTWLFGDGTKGQGVTAEHCYKKFGDYKVLLLASLKLDNDVTIVDTTIYDIGLNNIVVIKDNMAGASSVTYQYYFDGGDSFLKNGVPITNYYWDFGDGSFNCGRLVYTSYKKKGTYEVRLLVQGSDASGNVYSACGKKTLEIK